MSEIKNKEVEYLKKKISEVSYNPERFKLYFGEDKFLFGVVSAKNYEAPFSKLMQYKTIYDTLRDLDWKIKISFEKGIEHAYSKSVQEDFSIVHINSEEENLAYYYIENALFRTSSLWDMLAQLYCLFYEIKIPKDRIYYNKIFNPKSPNSNKFKDKATNINNYLKQEDDTSIDGEWKGNHQYTNDCRNKMTHRNSPNVTVMSDYDFNFKSHPSFLLKRIIEDYVIASKYVREVLDKIEKTIEK
ncbi:hypothetical protein FDF15_06015 [Clostridium botulinum]|uniref:Cthe_2314 family HEPN domain-containing protein n=1 Tax=Clostridium botulinum TaxID=1491 RepID=UPI000774B979|nr:Cthe_2314 family HEPN domain-containing protein [Clostridium botulinum]APH21614.1 hypothetical protein NPD1_3561 [Clostridium botulinum]APQ68311.1 hypothetical protein RSJ8_1687 [Clostridium botulinum]MBN3377408.1 hypothetical protein [Clostridium botulinum]MBN3404508.1 hypothetical protein [Clostridium botulinum]MBY6996876.1 hypothetical protein [Clostridium botulinum]